MKLFKKKDKNIEAEEALAKNAESAKTAADGKNTGAAQEAKEDVPETIVCPKCGKTVLKSVVKQHKYVCYECNYYFRVRAKNRIRMVSDKEAFEPWFTELTTGNPLNFPEYEEKIAKTQEKTGLSEGIVIGKTKIYGEETVLGVIDSRFMMGSMGHVVGEKITSAFERATEERLPVILFCCSGGARMQEGIISLMQMAYKNAMSIVTYKNYAINDNDSLYYYDTRDGRTLNRYLSLEDGQSRAALSEITFMSEDRSCVDLMLSTKGYYISDTFDENGVKNLKKIGRASCRERV